MVSLLPLFSVYINTDKIQKDNLQSRSFFLFLILVVFYGGCGIAMSFMAMNLGGTVLQVKPEQLNFD